jgi:hypothetical protein
LISNSHNLVFNVPTHAEKEGVLGGVGGTSPTTGKAILRGTEGLLGTTTAVLLGIVLEGTTAVLLGIVLEGTTAVLLGIVLEGTTAGLLGIVLEGTTAGLLGIVLGGTTAGLLGARTRVLS